MNKALQSPAQLPLARARTLLAAASTFGLLACGGGQSKDALSVAKPTESGSMSTALALRTNRLPPPPPAPPVTVIDALSLTDTAAPLLFDIGDRSYSAPVADANGKHSPANYRAAPKLPGWQFASVDPTAGVLSFERETAPDIGWHGYSRQGKLVVSGGSSAAANRIYTVFNKEQLLAALREAKNEPKIIRIVGHIDFRWSEGNSKFEEYTSYLDQKNGGSFSIPSNTTLVGINDANGRPARITGTTLLIGKEAAITAAGSEADFKAWVAAGKDPELFPTWTRNIILRNLQIDTPWDVNPEDSGNAYADGLTITRGQYIWIDHVTVSDGDTPDSLASDTRHDGALDIVRGSDYVTLSNNYFTKHGKTTLVGNGDSGRAWSDAGRLHVTFTGNWWNSTGSRLPLVRFGQVHLYNNLISGDTEPADKDLKFEGGLDVRYQADVISESNFYDFLTVKPKEICSKLGGGKDATSFRTSGHRFISNKTDDGKPMTTIIDADLQCGLPVAKNWVPPYAYTLRPADALRSSLRLSAGAGRIGMFATAAPAPSPAPTPAPSPAPTPAPTPAPSPSPSPAPAPAPGGSACTIALPCTAGNSETLMSSAVTATVPAVSYVAGTGVGGTYTVSGAGNMSNSNSYNFNFRYTTLVGDFSFTARIVSQGGASTGARAGVVAAAGATGTPAYAWTARYASTGEIRPAIQGNAKSAIAGFGSSTLPVWVRVQRIGSAVHSAASTDGVNWTQNASYMSSAAALQVGLAVSSGSNSGVVAASFDNVSVIGGGR